MTQLVEGVEFVLRRVQSHVWKLRIHDSRPHSCGENQTEVWDMMDLPKFKAKYLVDIGLATWEKGSEP